MSGVDFYDAHEALVHNANLVGVSKEANAWWFGRTVPTRLDPALEHLIEELAAGNLYAQEVYQALYVKAVELRLRK